MPAEIINVTTQEQLEAGLNIRKTVFVEEQNVPVEEEIDQYDVLSPDAHHILIQDGQEMVATGRLIYYKKDTAKLQRIAVLKPYRVNG